MSIFSRFLAQLRKIFSSVCVPVPVELLLVFFTLKHLPLNFLSQMRLTLLFLTFLTFSANCYKILVYGPKFGHSMSSFLGSIADTLVDAGHDVTSLISIIDPEVSDGAKKSTKLFVAQSEATGKLYSDFTKAKADFLEMNLYDPIGAYFAGKFFSKLTATQCRAVLESTVLLEQLKNEMFDVMILENFDMCGVALTEIIKPKSFIGSSSHVAFGPQLEEFGIPAFPSFDPSLSTFRMNVHSIWDRFLNVYADLLVRWSYYYMRTEIDELFQERFGTAFPSVKLIATHSAYNFVNSEPLIDFATPTVAKTIYIGGIGIRKPKSLSSDWEKILALRDKTVLISFGSVCKSMFFPLEVKRAILETIRTLSEVTFIWKYEDEDEFTINEASKVENLVLTKWMPQSDILNHPKLTAFITHGGMGSTLEMARAGVPGIFVPIFVDQPRNAAMMEYNGLGKILNKFQVSNSTKFVETIKEVIGNMSYQEKARRISAMLRKKPHTPEELVVKHVEFAAEFGEATALRPQSHEMTWIEYNNVDIVLIGILLCLFILVVCMKIVLALTRKIGKAKKKIE
ncbi:hypothetical protein PRIPAC_80661 [Pristionchus pacificus]|uniref:glucuronosyltransferase n=1 Tax=Pristionchus pacificus TaxID=54126 RepID=A0A2A6CL79_PRIPA|nr:hypothetical protein PRIPAC_80661 [Pristionchus pacificus]|eukprot:PDM78985.1 Glycosyltransferase [Pristionchus pacificus]